MEECDAIPDAGTSMWTARVLSIIVKNIQSYIVAIIWGTTEFFSLFKMMGKRLQNATSTVGRISASVTPSHSKSSGVSSGVLSSGVSSSVHE